MKTIRHKAVRAIKKDDGFWYVIAIGPYASKVNQKLTDKSIAKLIKRPTLATIQKLDKLVKYFYWSEKSGLDLTIYCSGLTKAARIRFCMDDELLGYTAKIRYCDTDRIGTMVGRLYDGHVDIPRTRYRMLEM